jgi:hypothetical protein
MVILKFFAVLAITLWFAKPVIVAVFRRRPVNELYERRLRDGPYGRH